jgi:hypothetical protein
MAATAIVLGTLREIWQETVPQGSGAPAIVTTGIRCDTRSLSKVRAQLVIDAITGAPAPAATAQISATGFLEFLVSTGGAGATMTWTLDAQLTHSVQQGNDRVHGAYISIVNSAAVGGGIASQTLAQTYAIGAVAADQRMVIDTAKGGGVVVEASTAAVTADGVSFEVRQNATWAMPVRVVRAGDDAVGGNVQFSKSRGTIAAPTSVISNDSIGDIDFYGDFGGAFSIGNRIRALCTAIDEFGWDTAIDFYAVRSSSLIQSWRLNRSTFIGYGIRDDMFSNSLEFRKARGTNAVPTAIQTDDLLGVIDFYGYNLSFNRYARVIGRATNVAGALVNSGIDFYVSYQNVEALSMAISGTATGTLLKIYNMPFVVPDVDGDGSIGIDGLQWGIARIDKIYAYENLAIGTQSILGGAMYTLLLTSFATMPAPQAAQVYIGAGLFAGGTTLATLALSAHEPAVVIGGATADYLIPVIYNGESFYLLADRIEL